MNEIQSCNEVVCVDWSAPSKEQMYFLDSFSMFAFLVKTSNGGGKVSKPCRVVHEVPCLII